MTIFESESHLLAILAEIESALERAAHAGGDIFRAFYGKAGHLYGSHALDGHESDDEERDLLAKHAQRIARIDEALDAARELCSEADAQTQIYQQAGRYGADEAARRLRVALTKQHEA